jgi:hypothetical protein
MNRTMGHAWSACCYWESNPAPQKAAVNAPQSKRFAKSGDARQSRSVWTARVFSTAFRTFNGRGRETRKNSLAYSDANGTGVKAEYLNL